jgi:hypothetical protein
MDIFYKKYLKYKMKYIELKQNGGYVKSHVSIFKIKSIGFEIETADFAPVIISNNVILPYGFHNTTGSVNITDISKSWIHNILPGRQILITQDDFSQDDFTEDDFSQDDFTVDIGSLAVISPVNFGEKILDKIGDDIGGSITNILNKYKKNIILSNYIISKHIDDISIYGHTEFIITYKSIIKSTNLIYEKFYEVFNLIKTFFNELKKIDKKKIYLYKHEQTETYFLSMIPKKQFSNIEITPQTTIGIDFIDIYEIIRMLEDDYISDMGENLYKNSLEKIITDLKILFGKELYEANNNYLALLYYCFLNTSSIFDYYYHNDARHNIIIGIDRDSLKIKPRHHFTNIKKYILSKDDLKDNYNRLLQFINNKINAQNIKNYRTHQLNILIMEQIKELFDKVDAQNYNNKIHENVYKFWGTNKLADIQTIIEKFKTLNKENNIFLYENVNDILDYIASYDWLMINNILDEDLIVSGGNLFEDCSTILLELRYINRKNTFEYDNTIDRHIENMTEYLKLLEVDESQVDESQVDESQVDESQVDESQVDESRPKRMRKK